MKDSEQRLAEQLGAAGFFAASEAKAADTTPMPTPPQQALPTRSRANQLLRLPRYWAIRGTLALNALAAVALPLSFVGSSSGLKVVSQVEWTPPRYTRFVYFCVGEIIAFKVDEHSNMALSNGNTNCPPSARPTAIVTSEIPGLFEPALTLLAISAVLQFFLVRRDD